MIESGEINPLNVVSHRVKMEDLDTVCYKFDEKADGVQKFFVQTKFSDPPVASIPSLTRYRS